jgi:hypothetical protein|nr:MAG TPA: putative periplasmic protein [Caudoviricetes sp.]
MKKTLLITAMFALVTVTGFARTEVSHDEFKALDGPKVLVHYDDGSTELLEEQEYLERTISMTQEEMDDLHKVDEGTKKALANRQADIEILRTYPGEVQQEQPKKEKKKHWYDNVLESIF